MSLPFLTTKHLREKTEQPLVAADEYALGEAFVEQLDQMTKAKDAKICLELRKQGIRLKKHSMLQMAHNNETSSDVMAVS